MKSPWISGLRSVALTVPDLAAAEAFYSGTWRLVVADRADGALYLRGCGADHPLLSLPAAAGTPQWGAGRHGPGDNAFNYFVDPFGIVIEYTAEVEQTDDGHRPGAPAEWGWPAGRVDRGASARCPPRRSSRPSGACCSRPCAEPWRPHQPNGVTACVSPPTS